MCAAERSPYGEYVRVNVLINETVYVHLAVHIKPRKVLLCLFVRVSALTGDHILANT